MRMSRMLLLLVATTAQAARWDFHNSFWINLHEALLQDAAGREKRDLGALSEAERAAWNGAVAAYRGAGHGDEFARGMAGLQDDLEKVADDAPDIAIEGALVNDLRRAAPVYRAHWWPADEKANRFFIGYASAMIGDAGEELIRAHEAVYHEQYPKSIRVDIAGYGGAFGAYTTRFRDSGWVTTMSSRDPGYQGLRPVEMILHEASHSVVGPNNGTVARAIAAAAEKSGMKIPSQLWHAILFETSGELARRALAARGSSAFEPSTVDMFTRVWPKYRRPIETYWFPYLSGKGTLEEAIEKIVESLKP